ncbi:TPA: cyclopropane fatty acyl phospholipid synthase [Candidatus Woesearchaeota archaeon]|nr:cyclopropane fatty acyl phospholipid synthase [Candidatus Woesearchaeota archaeon]HIH32032.1 cyclopropane fatty acyl phospholipid synthase [Candidatus Woesearchaeota archaeon]HIH54975.1 cyclopropane fatty acyl phospholipid synthase [Candidatus Woesearchaeota archaeon]HIJ01631.1 cyclopropane fatty acyl phospholipid synthase [Candidatus Woesearchaeota archaeon]HIJ13375.1 cyclopropane fatty acyl phospholipid synthase [Candidatus Woesearchaeota archaeon]
MADSKQVITKLLSDAGIAINGNNPWDIQVHNERLYSRILSGGSLALGESYMDGWWDSKAVDQFIYRVLNKGLDRKVLGLKNLVKLYVKSNFFNMQKLNPFKIGQKHYDIGNDLYKAMLDKNMQYSCGYWKNAKTLDQAQIAKMDLICRKLELSKGDRVLDIGCGWGTLLKYAAGNYGINGVGITVSKEQAEFARNLFKGLPLEVKLQDYRTVKDKFDKIVSVGMIEHVGFKNYKTFMKTVKSCLKDEGLFLLHTIGSNKTTTGPGEPWTDKYIFPDGKLPSIKQLVVATEGLFFMEDFHNIGHYYDPTLMAWNANFRKAWSKLRDEYDERFYRMWNYYLLSCAGGFRARHNQLWQMMFSNRKEVYEGVR